MARTHTSRTPAGYSATPLPAKLGIKADSTLLAINAPRTFRALIDPLPAGVRTLTPRSRTRADVVVCFATSAADLAAALPVVIERLQVDGGLWAAWPKRASGVATDLTEDRVRDLALALGLVDNKVCAIDTTWSGLRLVFRLADRPAIATARDATRGRPATSPPRRRSAR